MLHTYLYIHIRQRLRSRDSGVRIESSAVQDAVNLVKINALLDSVF